VGSIVSTSSHGLICQLGQKRVLYEIQTANPIYAIKPNAIGRKLNPCAHQAGHFDSPRLGGNGDGAGREAEVRCRNRSGGLPQAPFGLPPILKPGNVSTVPARSPRGGYRAASACAVRGAGAASPGDPSYRRFGRSKGNMSFDISSLKIPYRAGETRRRLAPEKRPTRGKGGGACPTRFLIAPTVHSDTSD